MKIVLASLSLALATLPTGAATLVSDGFSVSTTTTGWTLNNGVNYGINPPTTRLTGTVAGNLRYIDTVDSGRAPEKYGINNNRLRVESGTGVGRFTLSADGLNPFDFGAALGVPQATPANPTVYDVKIGMRNDAAGTERLSFGIATAEGDVTTLDFGMQMVHAAAADRFYTLYKRIDTASAGVDDVNAFMGVTATGTTGQVNNILIRITDAGPETNTFSSRVQVSLNDGATWIYDTDGDAALPNGWRFDGPGRVFVWDQAPNTGNVYYDTFIVSREIEAAAGSVELISPVDGTRNVTASVQLSAMVSNAVGNTTVTFYGRQAPKPYPGPDFCIAVLPDTQNYAREAAGNGDAVKEMWFSQTEWIINNRVAHNIAYVAHLGDIVQNGDVKDGNPNLTEWRNATNAMYRLENPTRTGLADGIPYGMAAGNHDQEPIGDENGQTSFFNQYFGVSHFQGRSYYGGNYGDNNDSHYDVFRVSGLDFLAIYFEYGRYGTGVMDWANDVIAAHPNHRVLAITHHAGSDRTPSSFSAQGSAIFNALKGNTNFFMMLGGHVASNGGEGSRTDSYLGRTIRTFISDYQGWLNGGNGFMRLMYFSPSNNTVTIKTYSPWLNEYRTDSNSQMTFPYDMSLPTGPGSPGTPYAAIATNASVAPNATTTCTWAGLQPNKNYDWYAQAAGGSGSPLLSATWQFQTALKFAPNNRPLAGNQFLSIPGDAPKPLTLQGSDPDGEPVTFQITAQPLNGSTADFDSSAGTLTYLPARGYRGPDRLSFIVTDGLTNSLQANLNLSLVGPPDADGDGLSDAWENGYGATDPNADLDGDGFINLSEYQANTNPTNSDSALRIASIEKADDEIEIVWSSVGGTRYRVQYSDAQAGGGPAGPFTDIVRFIYDEMDAAAYGEASSLSFIDTAPVSGCRFYRIRLIP